MHIFPWTSFSKLQKYRTCLYKIHFVFCLGMTLGNCVLPHPYPSDFLAEYFYQKEVSHEYLVKIPKQWCNILTKWFKDILNSHLL